MINKIIDAISEALFNEFGESFKIYTDDVKQGHKKPCFSIFCINPNRQHFFNKKYYSRNIFMILYFPSTDEPSLEINDITERLYDCLEYISESDDLIRGTNLKGETINGVLNFMVNYDLFIMEKKDEQSMETLDASMKAKG